MTRRPELRLTGALLGAMALCLSCVVPLLEPRITSLQPAGALAGSEGFTLEIHGEDFEPDAIVRFGGVTKTVTFVGPKLLEIQVDPAEVAEPGPISVALFTVTDATGAGGVTSRFFTVHAIEELLVEPEPDVSAAPDGLPVYATTGLGTLTATAFGGGLSRDVTEEAEWSSSDDGVATVFEGLVGPQAEGNVRFEATLDDVTGSMDAHVIDPATATLQPASLAMQVGDVMPLTLTSANGLALETLAQWSSNPAGIADVDPRLTEVLVRGVAEGTTTVVAALFGESLTAEVTVSGGGGGGQTSAERVFMMSLDVPAEAFAVPYDATSGAFGTPLPRITLSGSPISSAYDPAEKILAVVTSEGVDVFHNQEIGLPLLKSTPVPNTNSWGDLRYHPVRADFTTENRFGTGQVHRIRVAPSTGDATVGVAVDNLPTMPALSHWFFPVPDPNRQGFMWLAPPNTVLSGSGMVGADGTLSDIETDDVATGMGSNLLVATGSDESTAWIVGSSGIVKIEVDDMGTAVAASDVEPTNVNAGGLAVNSAGTCGYVWESNNNRIEVFDLDDADAPTSVDVVTRDELLFVDGILAHPESDVMFTLGRHINDDAIISAAGFDSGCTLTWGDEIIVPAGGGLLTGTVMR